MHVSTYAAHIYASKNAASHAVMMPNVERRAASVRPAGHQRAVLEEVAGTTPFYPLTQPRLRRPTPEHRRRPVRVCMARFAMSAAWWSIAVGCVTAITAEVHGATIVSPTVVEAYPHDPAAFTEGLVFDGTTLFESTGEFGRSTLRRVDVATGDVLQLRALADNEFGEGLALVDDRLIQLTYQNNVAHVYDAITFDEVTTFDYEGEGWGLCYDGDRLIMSDGTERLSFRDPDTFQEQGSVRVTQGGRHILGLNELECVGREVFANIFPTTFIFRIDASSGEVLTRIDARALLDGDTGSNGSVLNGIAFRPTDERFLLTGKYLPTLFEVEIPLPAITDVDVPPSSPHCSGVAEPTEGWGSALGVGLLAIVAAWRTRIVAARASSRHSERRRGRLRVGRRWQADRNPQRT